MDSLEGWKRGFNWEFNFMSSQFCFAFFLSYPKLILKSHCLITHFSFSINYQFFYAFFPEQMIISTFASLTVVFNSKFILLLSPLMEVGPVKKALPCSSSPRAHFRKLQLKCLLFDSRQIWCCQSNDLHQSTYFMTVRDFPHFALLFLLLIVKAISIPLHIYFLNVENEFKNLENPQ